MSDPVRLKVFHLDSTAQQCLNQLFELRLDEIWTGGLHTCLGMDHCRASWLRIRTGDEQWLELNVDRHQFNDGFTVGSLGVRSQNASLPPPEETSWINLSSAVRIIQIDIYEQRELIDIVAPGLDFPAESLNYDALLVLHLDNASALMVGLEQNFVEGELVILQTDQPEQQLSDSLRLRRTLTPDESPLSGTNL